MDLKRVCRICLMESSEDALDIFTSCYTKGNCLYSEMISRCTKLKPRQGDGLPRLICKTCNRQLKRTYIFNVLCEESDKKLRYYQEVTHNLIRSLEKKPIKSEALEEFQNAETVPEPEHKFVISIVDNQQKFEGAVKSEPAYIAEPSYVDNEDGSCWDADDDNLVLGQIKLNKAAEERNKDVKPRKKKQEKKKGFRPGEPQSSKLPHQCDVCGKVLSTKSNMKAHKVCHTDLRPYQCESCPASFRGHSALFQHKKTHSGATPYHCSYCPKQFSRRTGLVNHVRMHTGDKQFSCEICCKTFVQSGQLSIHMKRHKGDKSFLCQDCGKGFPIKADLKVHQRSHNGEKPYACHLCTKSFSTSGNLSIHIRIHNKEVRYNCKECSRGFVTRSAFVVHVKRHKGQRDYACECGKTFYTSSALKQHKVVHTGEKKYQCKICERKFTQTSHLSRHFKRDHAKPNAPVPSSDYYKLVLPPAEPVKCEGS